MRYAVQVLRVMEVEVEATDDLQAEREAYSALNLAGNEIAIYVAPSDEADGGALQSEDNSENWEYAKTNFWTLDPEWAAS